MAQTEKYWRFPRPFCQVKNGSICCRSMSVGPNPARSFAKYKRSLRWAVSGQMFIRESAYIYVVIRWELEAVTLYFVLQRICDVFLKQVVYAKRQWSLVSLCRFFFLFVCFQTLVLCRCWRRPSSNMAPSCPLAEVCRANRSLCRGAFNAAWCHAIIVYCLFAHSTLLVLHPRHSCMGATVTVCTDGLALY